MSEKKNNTRPKNVTMKTALLSFGIVAVIVFVFDSEGLKTWAEQLKDQAAQTVYLPPLKAWYDFTDTLGLTGVREMIRDGLFVPVRDANFFGPETAEPVDLAVTEADNRPPAPSPLDHRIYYTITDPLEILVLGDSMAGLGIPPMFNRTIAGKPGIRITFEAHVSSSITNPVYFDWSKEIYAIFETHRQKYKKHFDLIIVVLGGNDAQSFRLGDRFVQFGTDEWLTLYHKNATEFMNILTAHADKVYWTSIVPMRLEGYKDRMVRLNGIFRELTLAYGTIRFVSLDSVVGDENGLFTPTKVIGNEQQIVRQQDGIHLSYAGAQLVVDELMKLIDADFSFTR